MMRAFVKYVVILLIDFLLVAFASTFIMRGLGMEWSIDVAIGLWTAIMLIRYLFATMRVKIEIWDRK